MRSWPRRSRREPVALGTPEILSIGILPSLRLVACLVQSVERSSIVFPWIQDSMVSLKKACEKYGPNRVSEVRTSFFAATSVVWSAHDGTISLDEQTLQLSSLWSFHLIVSYRPRITCG